MTGRPCWSTMAVTIDVRVVGGVVRHARIHQGDGEIVGVPRIHRKKPGLPQGERGGIEGWSIDETLWRPFVGAECARVTAHRGEGGITVGRSNLGRTKGDWHDQS